MKISPVSKAKLVMIGKDVSSKELVFRTYAEGLRFPPYFANNWDSFEECLSDLEWLPNEVVVIYHKEWAANPLRQDNTYIDIVESVAQEPNSKLVILYD